MKKFILLKGVDIGKSLGTPGPNTSRLLHPAKIIYRGRYKGDIEGYDILTPLV